MFALQPSHVMGALTSVQRARLEELADDERTAELKAGFCNADPITKQGTS